MKAEIYKPYFLAIIAGLSLPLASNNDFADTKTPAGDKVAAEKASPVKAPIRMSESQMDKVVAGTSVFQIVYINGVCYYLNTNSGSTRTCH